MLKVVIKKPGENPYTDIIDGEPKDFQNIVGGDIEAVPFRDFLLVRNDSGRLLSLTPNFFNGNDLICGTAFFVGLKGKEFKSLEERQINGLMEKFVSRSSRGRESSNPRRRR